jgi:GDP-L-fucose synthase
MNLCLSKESTILVTGAGGVIGHALTSELQNQGYANIVAISSEDGDLCDFECSKDIFQQYQPELVFHLAARVSGIMGNMKNRALAYLDNIRINTNVIEAAHLNGAKKIVAMGTTAIYSDIVPLPMCEEDIWLGPPHASEAPYGHAKRAMLAQLEAYHEQYGLDYAYCISTNLYGPFDRFDEEYGHVLPSLISKFHRARLAGEDVIVWGDGSPQRDFLYSKDAARALCLIAERGNGAINLAGGAPVSIKDAVETLAEVSGFTKDVIWDSSKPNGQMLRQYSTDKLINLGFAPTFSLKEGLQETYDWYKDNYEFVRR